MCSQSQGGLSAITQVKVSSPEIVNIALGQGVHEPEASTAARAGGECVCSVPGSKSVAGNLTVHIGTWESHVVPTGSFQQAGEARRRYGDVAVGLSHIKAVVGVMPGESQYSLEGDSGKTQRDEQAGAIHGDG